MLVSPPIPSITILTPASQQAGSSGAGADQHKIDDIPSRDVIYFNYRSRQ